MWSVNGYLNDLTLFHSPFLPKINKKRERERNNKSETEQLSAFGKDSWCFVGRKFLELWHQVDAHKGNMMYLKTVLLRKVLCFTFMCCCLSYNEDLYNFNFSKIPESCAPESCSDSKDSYGINGQRCDCEETCSRYGTCCFDSPRAIFVPTKTFVQREQCSKVQEPNFGAFMISYCNPRWRGHQVIRTLCEGIGPSERDPLAGIPVTNPFSKNTYKNFFCSLCNFDHRGGILWEILLTFSHNNAVDVTQNEREGILRRLEYNRDEDKWGIWNTSDDGSVKEFMPLSISPQIPSSVRSVAKVCDFSVESRCARTWNDLKMKRRCQSYIAPITLPMGEGSERRFVKFRNPHCAMCNYVTEFEEAICIEIRQTPSLSFTLLIDVNPADGDVVGETKSCAPNEVNDPFFKKCRALVCALPGYTVKNGRCTNA